jgi:hypothetical protein
VNLSPTWETYLATPNFGSQFLRNGSMLEIVVAIAAAVSVSIFLVHAVEAYLTQ